MWTSNRKQEGLNEECAADQGLVTLGGDPAAVYLGGERRWVSLYAPGGYQWRPKAGDHREMPCLVGRRPEEGSEEELSPGAVRIHSGTGAVLLDEDGLALSGDEVALKGDITVNGKALDDHIETIVYQVLASMMG